MVDQGPDQQAEELGTEPSATLSPDASQASLCDLQLAPRSASAGAPSSPARHPSPPLPSRSHGSWVRRVQNKSEELRKLFRLPPEEQLMDDYLCALRKKILFQGRLFVFAEHLGFYANLFGYRKVKTIRLQDVVSVQRKKNVGFPNSVEIRTVEGLKFFFTSFLSREDAYRLIVGLWRQCSEHAKAQPPSDDEAPGGGGARRHSAPSRRVSRLLSRVVGRDGSQSACLQGEQLAGVTFSAPVMGSMGAARHLDLGEQADNEASGDDRRYTSDAAPNAEASQQSEGLAGSPSYDLHTARSLTSPLGDGDEFKALTDQQCEEAIDCAFSSATRPVPPVEQDSKLLLEFDLPCSPREFWCRFLSNSSDFFYTFHAAQQHHSLKISKWQQHVAVGMVRDLQFVSPLKFKMGPPQTLCNQAQRYQVYAGDHLVFETSQVQVDIPYGDHFRVETRMDVVPINTAACHVTAHLRIPFTKSTVWKKFIEKGTTEASLEAMNTFKRLAIVNLEERDAHLTSPGAVAAAAAAAAGASGSSAAAAAAPAAEGGVSPATSRGFGHQGSGIGGSSGLPQTEEEWEELVAAADPRLQPVLKRALQSQQGVGGRGGGGAGSWTGAQLTQSTSAGSRGKESPTPGCRGWALSLLLQLLLCALCLGLLLTQLAILRRTATLQQLSSLTQHQPPLGSAHVHTGACNAPAPPDASAALAAVHGLQGELLELVRQLGEAIKAGGAGAQHVQQQLGSVLSGAQHLVGAAAEQAA